MYFAYVKVFVSCRELGRRSVQPDIVSHDLLLELRKRLRGLWIHFLTLLKPVLCPRSSSLSLLPVSEEHFLRHDIQLEIFADRKLRLLPIFVPPLGFHPFHNRKTLVEKILRKD